MFSGKKWLIVLTIMTAVLLTACSSSNASKLIGSWKVVVGENVNSYVEIGEERVIIRSDLNDSPMSAAYILTETQNDRIMMEVINPENGSHEFMFEGYFENKDKITVVQTPDGAAEETSELIRVDNIAEEIEQKRVKEIEEEELAKEEKNRLQIEKEKELAEEKERKRLKEKEEKELAIEKEGSQQQNVNDNSVKKEYLQMADDLEDGIMREAKELFAHDMQAGFYGEFYSEWDSLLNEVWGVLNDTMPQNEMEKLKSEQIDWIEMKEHNFAEIPDEPASERARGIDYLAFETKERTYYLIENYMN